MSEKSAALALYPTRKSFRVVYQSPLCSWHGAAQQGLSRHPRTRCRSPSKILNNHNACCCHQVVAVNEHQHGEQCGERWSIPGEGFREPMLTESSTCRDPSVGPAPYRSVARPPLRELAEAFARLLTRSWRGLSCLEPPEGALYSTSTCCTSSGNKTMK